MTVDIGNTKLRLIELVMSIDDNAVLNKLEQEANRLKDSTPKPDIALAVRPIRSNITLEDIDREQNYNPLSYKEFRVIADPLQLEEPIEELLKMLTK